VSETSFQIPDTVRVETLYVSHFLAENPIACATATPLRVAVSQAAGISYRNSSILEIP
jgi:hypothetical protein